MPGVSAGDVWRLYVKPSLDGRLVIRKKTVMRRSARVLERNRTFAATIGRRPQACGGQGPTGVDGRPHTPIKKFIACLRGGAMARVPAGEYLEVE